jgi:hypothetical protein
MLFNQLTNLIYHAPQRLSNELCESLLTILGDNITEFTVKYDEEHSQLAILLEELLTNDLYNFITTKNALIPYSFVTLSDLCISEFTIINNDEYHNRFDVCHTLTIYKYLMVMYFLDDNSIVTFFNTHDIHPKKGDVVIFPIAWFFVYKNAKKNKDIRNVYLYNNVLKQY